MLTGRQIREARTLLGLHRSVLAYKVKRITTLAIIRAEEAAVVQQTLERLGIEFGVQSVRLRKAEP